MLAPILLATTTILSLATPSLSTPLKTPTISKRGDFNFYNRAFLVNCWTNGSSGGARSEVALYENWPPTSSAPDSIAVVQDGSNYIWEQGGEVTVDGARSFTWSITAENVGSLPAGTTVGTAHITLPDFDFTLDKDTEEVLYTASDGLQCRSIYEGYLNN